MNKDDTILLVEDNEDDVFLMRRALKAAGVANPIVVAEHGQDAIDYLSGKGKNARPEGAPLPALIFLDLKLPFVKGLDVLAWMKKDDRLSSLIVVVLSSSEEPGDVTEAYRLGANSYLVKPPTVSQLHELAKTCKLYWLDQNRIH